MTLRRKLLTVYAAVGLLSLLLAAMTLWATMTLQDLHHEMEDHYRRSLLLQSVRSSATVAFREHVPDMVAEVSGAREKFERGQARVHQDLEAWEALVQADEHRANLEAVAEAWGSLLHEVEEPRSALDDGRPEKAVAWLYRFKAGDSLDHFVAITDAMAEYDEDQRALIQARVESTRGTIEVVALVAGAGTLSLVFLLVAYLASDLFAPLRDLEQALVALGRGQVDVRLEDRRQDEFGQVHRAFNQAVRALSNQVHSNGADDAEASRGVARTGLIEAVREVQAGLAELDGDAEQSAELNDAVGRLEQGLSRLVHLAFPLEPAFTSTVVRGLLYDVLLYFNEELARRGVSVELVVQPDVGRAQVDPVLLREAVRELVRNALEALPEQGGRLGLRAGMGADGLLVLEVADDGRGVEISRLQEASGGGAPRLGLWLVREIVERHGGRVVFDSAPGEGTHVQLRIPSKPGS